MIPLLIVFLAAGSWCGAIAFQSAFVAPAVFTELEMHSARLVLRRLFPRFFALGIGLCASALAAAPFLRVDAGLRRQTIIILAAMLIAIVAALSLVPAINAASDAGLQRRFRFLHGASVLLTLLSLAGAVTVIATLASRFN